jgi:hypothetical protein
MSEKSPACPHCGQPDQVIKVNRIYMESISSSPLTDESVIPRVLNWPADKKPTSFRTLEEQRFLKYFKPPSTKPSLTRTVSPDQVVFAFSILSIFFLYQIYRTQPEMFLPMIAVLASFYLVYLLGRKRIIGKYQVQKSTEFNQSKKYEAAVGRWMQLYYCIRDNGVFDPRQDRWIALEEMDSYLMGDHS